MDTIFKRVENDNAILTIYYDDSAFNPREYDSLGTLICWHNRYNIGDPHNYEQAYDFFRDLAEEVVPQSDIEDYWDKNYSKYVVKKDSKGRWGIYNKDNYPLFGFCYGYDNEQDAIDELEEIKANLMDYLDDRSLLELVKKYVVILPVYLYDHSYLSISTTKFSCQWDSGQVGWIYATKEKFIKETTYPAKNLFGTDPTAPLEKGDFVIVKGREDMYGRVEGFEGDNVKVDWTYAYHSSYHDDPRLKGVFPRDYVRLVTEKAKQILISEIELYDQYLRGDVFGYVIEEKTHYKSCEHCDREEETKTEVVDSCWGFFGHDFKENGLLDHIPEKYKDLLELLDR